MMHFYYDPILGLQYTYLDTLLVIDLAVIPPKTDLVSFAEEWRKLVREQGIQILDSTIDSEPVQEVPMIISNF